MSNAMTNQCASSGEGPGIGKDGIGLAAYRSCHRGIKINQVGVVTGKMLVVIDTMGIMADRTWRTAARHQMVTVSTTSA